MIPCLPGSLLALSGLALAVAGPPAARAPVRAAGAGALASYKLGWEREQKGDLAGAAAA